MTNTLIIYAHPMTPGHCQTILETVEEKLTSKNINYEVIDLYKTEYDPILHEDEMYIIGNKNISKQNREFQKKIKLAQHLIFIYPIWWGTMPAILKGFFDKTLTSGFAYEYKNNIPRGLLKGKKAIIFMTSGSPAFLQLFMGKRYSKNIRNDILKFCGIKSASYQIDNARKLNDKQINKINRHVDSGLKWLY